MNSKMVRLDENVYERLEAVKREDETFSEAVDRLLSEGSLLDLVGLWSDAELADVREVLEDVDEDARQNVDEVLNRVSDGE